MLKVKSDLLLLKLEIHCMIGRKDKFTSNDQNTNCFFGKPKNSLTGENVKFFVFQGDEEKSNIYKKTQNANVCLRFAFQLFMIYHQIKQKIITKIKEQKLAKKSFIRKRP